MDRVKIGVIGCGNQAQKHISSLKKIPLVDIVITDVRTGIAKEISEKQRVGFEKDPENVIQNNDIDAVVIATPTHSHIPLIKNAIQWGKKVFCEKPLSDDIDEIYRLKEFMSSKKNILMIGYIYRFVPVFEECYKIIKDYEMGGSGLVLGKPLVGFFRLGGKGSHQAWKHRKSEGGGAINEMLVHMVDLANWYFGPLQNIELLSHQIHLSERVIDNKNVSVDAEDFIMVKCRGHQNIELFLQADLITPAFSQYVEIQGENGTFRGSIQMDSPSFVFLKESRGGYDAGKTDLKYGQRSLLDIQTASFIKSVVKNQEPDRNTLDDTLQLMKVIEEIRNQIRENL